MLLQVLLLILAIIILYFGAEFALDGAEVVGSYFGLPPLVIGLLIVGFGTSLPEFFVSHLACYRGQSEIALGNIVGSNIANLFLILGVSGTMTTLYILRREIITQFIVHIFLTAFLIGTLYYGKLNFITMGIFVAFFLVYLWHTFSEMKKHRGHLADEEEVAEEISTLIVFKLLVGFVLLYVGGELLVSSGSKIGLMLGIKSYIISAIFIAFGTSFPELITALLACKKGKNTDLITGNIIGSNIFNVAFVMGGLGIYNVEIKQDFMMESIVLGGAAFFLIFLVIIKKNFGRPAGVLFLGSYAFVVYQWIS